MRYMLLIYGDESSWADVSEADQQANMQEWFAYHQALTDSGQMEGGEPLESVSTATSVRDDGGRPLVTDGPFAETKEQLGGYYIIDVPDLDAAIAWAHKCPGAKNGTVEVRPIMEMPSA